MKTLDDSPIVTVLRELHATDPKWRVDIAEPRGEAGWIAGLDFVRATEGPFHALLRRTGERLGTDDRKTIAALFALRFGWAAAVAITPCLTHNCVPDVALENISLKFREDTLYDRTALHEPCGFMLAADHPTRHPLVETVPDRTTLLRCLRELLSRQSHQVIQALHAWSGFSVRGAWGMVTSAWASHFITVCDRLGDQRLASAHTEAFFSGDDDVARMQPRLHPVTLGQVTHLFQRRASCCRYYLLPRGSLCASCPLVSQEERVRRNLEWMQRPVSRT